MKTLYTCSLSELKNFSGIEYKYLITRYCCGVSIDGLDHMPELSPSPELLREVRQRKSAGTFDRDWFKDKLINELSDDPDAFAAIDDIGFKLSENDVLLVCFCKDPQECHRSLLAEYLQEWGFDIEIH